MRAVDTSVWIEWLIGSRLSTGLAQEIPDKAHCIVPTIVQLELAKWLTREAGGIYGMNWNELYMLKFGPQNFTRNSLSLYFVHRNKSSNQYGESLDPRDFRMVRTAR